MYMFAGRFKCVMIHDDDGDEFTFCMQTVFVRKVANIFLGCKMCTWRIPVEKLVLGFEYLKAEFCGTLEILNVSFTTRPHNLSVFTPCKF